MTLFGIIDKLKMLALKHPNINGTYEGNIYDIMNGNTEHKYASIVITQDTHSQDDTYDYYNLNMFYVDRLVDNMESNRLQVQSTGKNMLSNIIQSFCEEFDADCERIEYHTFTEKFTDECAGVYATITISIVKDYNCNEKYWEESWNVPLISIKNQNKKVEFTENGIYTIEYDATQYTGLGKVEVEVNVPDFNGSYDEGYSQGKLDGYNEGKTDGYTEGKDEGINEQKSKLEGISITENGTYTKEDGYNQIIVDVPDVNGSYDEGYKDGKDDGIEEGISNAGEIIAETAQVLNVTENGTYTTQYTKNEDIDYPITGYFDDGTPFYDYAHLTTKAYNTNVVLTKDSVVEIWWKPDFNYDRGYSTTSIVGSDIDYGLEISVNNETYPRLNGNTGYLNRYSDVIEDKWYHLVLSLKDEFIVNGKKITSNGEVGTFREGIAYINISDIAYTNQGAANGYFGMVKIDGKTFIPTENGYIDFSTKQPLIIEKEGDYEFVELPPFEGNLIRTVNVNVVPKINVQKEGIKFACSSFKEIPEWADWDGITDMKNMFYQSSSITSIPPIDTSNVTNMYYTFAYCSVLTNIPQLDTSNVTDMNSMFYNCINLVSIPQLDTSKVTNMNSMFSGCSKLAAIPQLDTGNVTNISAMFSNCSSLTSVPALKASKLSSANAVFGYSDLKNLTDFGGFIGLKTSITDNYTFIKLPNLTYESCINVLNGLYDFTDGVKPTSSQGKLKVHSNFLTLVGDELSIGINKGWTITV